MPTELAIDRCTDNHRHCWRVILWREEDSTGEPREYARHLTFTRATALVLGIPLAEMYRRMRAMDEEDWQGRQEGRKIEI